MMIRRAIAIVLGGAGVGVLAIIGGRTATVASE